jgi:hypothetical protein
MIISHPVLVLPEGVDLALENQKESSSGFWRLLAQELSCSSCTALHLVEKAQLQFLNHTLFRSSTAFGRTFNFCTWIVC